MLVLSFELGQRVMIDGRKIVVTVLEIRGNRVRLGFDADRSISIHREVVYDDIERRGKIQDGLRRTAARR